MAVVVAAGVLGSVLGVVPGGLGSGVVEAQSAGTAGVSAYSRAFLHRTVIEEGQTRQFEISNLPDRPAYYVFFKPLAGYTAEASDIVFKVPDQSGTPVEVAAGEGSRAFENSLRERLRFEVEARADSPADSDDETFGVRLCTTADCTGGTVLGDWTVTITDVSDTTLMGTGASITVSGGSTTMMERLTNNDNRDVADTITVNIPYASRLSQSIVVVGLVNTTTSSKLGADTPIANIASGFAQHATVGPATPRVAFIIDLADLDTDDNGTVELAEWVSEYEVPIAAFNNAVDTPGGELSGNLVFTVYQYDSDYYDTTDVTVNLGNGPQTVKGPDTSTAPTPYTGIVLPDVPLTVTGDDEVTEIELHHAATIDNVAIEGGTDTAKFRVTLGRALAAGETLAVPLAFQGATLGTHFTLSLDGTPQGVAYADSADGTTGELVFTGPSAAEATVVVAAAADDGDTVTNNLVVRTYPTSEPWKGNHITTNLAGGVCSGDGCGPGRLAERMHRVTLTESAPGVSVIDNGGGRVSEGDTYSYGVQLNAAPTADVTVAVTAAAGATASPASLTFTTINWRTEQPVRITAAQNIIDAPDAEVAITHAIASSDNAYSNLADVTHTVTVVDDEATVVTMTGTGVRAGGSDTNISSVMVEGDATRVDRSLTISLSRALTDGEYVRVPLYLEAAGHRVNPDVDCDLSAWWNSLENPPDYGVCDAVTSYRGTRYSTNVSWPTKLNDFEMAVSGTGVSVEAVNRYTPPHAGFRFLEFRGAGARTAALHLNARAGFDDGESHDEQFSIRFPNDLAVVTDGQQLARRLNPQTNLGGSIEPWKGGASAWFGIADDDGVGGSDGIPLSADSPLVPSGLSAGDEFRLIYVTSQTTQATDPTAAFYDRFVRAEITGDDLVNGGVTALVSHAESFRAIVGTSTPNSQGQFKWTSNPLSARVHARFSPYNDGHPDTAIYWVGGTKVADDNADFIDRTWDDEANPKHADGTAATINANGYWTGTQDRGAFRGSQSDPSGENVNTYCRSDVRGGDEILVMGASWVYVGHLNGGFDDNPLGRRVNDSNVGHSAGSDACRGRQNTDSLPLYALSGKFVVVGAVGVEDATAAEGSSVNFTVSRPEASPSPVTVTYTISDGRGIADDPAHIVATGASGGAGADYTNDFAGAGTVTIAANATSATISVPTTADSTYEGDHYFTVTLTDATPGGIDTRNNTALGVITDNADLPTVSFSSAAVSAAEGDDTVDVTVAKTGTTLVPSSVFWTTADGNGGSGAAHPGDYTAQSGYLEFAPNEASKTLTIGLVDDDTAESAETFKVQLDATLAVDAQIGSTAETTITLTDDDGNAVVVAPGEVSVVARGTVEYDVQLASDPGGTVVVTPTSSDTTKATVSSALTFNSSNWNVPQQVTVTGVDAGSTTVTHAVTTATAAYPMSLNIASVDVTVTAAGPVTMSMAGSDGDASGNAVEGASGTTGYRTITLMLGRALTGSETVTVPLSVVGATVTDDYTFGLEPATQTGVSLTTTGGTHTAQNPAVVFAAGASSATLRLKPVDNSVRSQPYVVVGYGTGARAPAGSGVTLGTVSGGPVGVVLVDDETGDFEVAADWPLLPSGLSAGDEFRLMFITSQTRTAESTDIDVYNEWARGVVAAGGHASLKPYGDLVRVVGSTTVDARVNTGMYSGSAWADGSANASDSGVAVYWLAEPPSNKVADNYFDFYDGDWDGGADQSGADTIESGAERTASTYFWTGTDNDGTNGGTRRLGRNRPYAARVASGNPLSDVSTAQPTARRPMLVMSPVFKVEAAATPELTFASAAYSVAEDGGSVDVTVNASSAPSAALTVNLDSQAETATEASDYTAPPTTFTFPAAMTSHTFSVNITDDNTVEGDETFTMTLASGTGYTVGTPATTTVTITDDETPPVTVTMSASDGDSDGNAVEGAAGTTGYRTITLTLGRALTGSETATVPLTVVGATVATDFTFGLQPSTQTGVSLNTSGSNSAQNPAVVFASGPRTATLRLTPVDNNVRTQPYAIVDYGSGSRAPTGSGGVTLDTPTGGPIGVVLVDDETGDIVLPAGAGFRPGVSNNAEYRLLFMTSAGGAATSTDIADYDHFVRAAAVANGGADLLPYAGFFRAFVSTASTHGREHVGIWGSGAFTDGTTPGSGSGTALYWLGTGGEQVSSGYWLFCNRPWTGRWSATATRLRHEDGSVGDGAKVWTGMNNNCTTSSNQLGTSTPTYGPGAQAGSGGSPTQPDALSLGTEAAASENRFYAVSDVFKTVASADMPQVVFTVRTGSANEGETVRLTVEASPAPTDDLTVTYVVGESDDSATAGQDFTASEASVTIPAGQTSVAFDVATLEDGVFEDSETFRVRLAASPDYLRGSVRVVIVTILDDDAVEIGFEQPEFWVLEDSGTFDVNLTLNQETEQQIDLTLAFGGTATDGSDYTAPSTSVTIPSGNTSGTHTISIPITADSMQEADETIVVRIASSETRRATAATPDRTTLYIADQDHASAGLVVPPTVEVREGGEATYWLRLATQPTGTVTVTVVSQSTSTLTVDADDSAGGDQNSVQFTTSNWYVGRKITVRGVHDADLTDDSVSLSHSASGADYGIASDSVPVTVDDEDVTLSIAGGAAVTEGTPAEFTVTASPAPDRDLTVNVDIADAADADFIAAGQQGNRTRILRSGQSSAMFTVPTVADHNVEPSGPITITLQNSDNYRIDSSAASAMVQVNDDDDAAVAVAMSASRDNAVEGAGNATGYSDITLTLDGALTGAATLTVPLTVTGATVTTDYTFGLVPAMQTGVTLDTSGPHSAQNPAVVFTTGATTATLRLTPVDNDVRTQPYVIVDFGPGATASGGINVGEQTDGPINVVLVDDETGDIEVAADWALAPSGLSAGDEFRLIFITSQRRTAASTDIDDYNDWAQLVVAEHGHSALLPYSGLVSVIASTATVDARENTAMWDPALNSNAGGYTDSSTNASDSGTKIYWLAAPSAHKVADNYFDFYDASWDTGTNNRSHSTNEAATKLETVYWTGSSDAGVAVSGNALGEANPQYGHVETSGNTPLDHTVYADNATLFRLLAMSPVFTVAAAPSGPEVSVRLLTGEGENRNADGEVEKPEAEATVSFPLTLDAQPAAALTVCVRVAESGDTDRVAAAGEGIKTVSFMAGVQSGSIDVAWTDNDDDDLDSVITVTAVPSSTAGCTSTDAYTVSGTNGSDKVRIADDEATEVTLTASDTAMSEQDASDTATLTVSSGRPLIAGESLASRITLATSTGARLPGHATPDFAVTATGTGVVLTNATSTTPLVTFTGSDSNTVQTATLTLTPISTAAGDDGDTSDEEITATLSVIGGTGSGTVVTGGGVEVAPASSEVDLTINDDEASACSAQSTVLSVSSLRITENGGVATYCVRLTTAPSGGSTTVAIGTTDSFPGAATASPSSLVFTASNYTEPQEVTVTGVDESGMHRDRSLSLTHTASGGGQSGSVGNVVVEVLDAPEVEVFEHVRYDDEAAWRRFVNANGGMLRPSTITAAPGITAWRNITPCCELQYAVRLSNRPVGGPVTVIINVVDFGSATASNITGISLTRDGPPLQSLSITFEDRDPAPGCGWLVQRLGTHEDSNGRTQPGVSDSYDDNTDTSWECYRFIWVHNKRDHLTATTTLCADITHVASGGGVRKVTVDTIRMHSLGFINGRSHYHSGCPFLYANTLGSSQNSPLRAQTAPVPTTTVAGLSVTDSGSTSVTAAWDAVPHATKYRVSYSAQADDGSLTQTTGAFDDITTTSHTFDHGVTAPATVTVTVTPGYDTSTPDSGTGSSTTVVYLDDLAATATLQTGATADQSATAEEAETGDEGPTAPPPGCVSDDTLELARDYYDLNKHRAPGYGKNWRRVLIAFGDLTDTQLKAFTAAEARQSETRWSGWRPFREALECIEQAQQDPAPPVEPEITIAAGNDVTEGGNATFTITAAPSPAAGLDVTIEITQSGDFASTGTRTVTIPSSGTYTLTVATTDDSTDEADGSVTATIDDGTGYTVSSSDSAATVNVADDDDPPPVTPQISITAGPDVTEGGDAVFSITASPAPATGLDVTIEITQSGAFSSTGTHTVTIPTTGAYTLTVATTDDDTDEADGSITATIDDGTGYTISTTAGAATIAVADDDIPEITITAGADVTEGDDAVFTITADPAPHTALDVAIEVTQTGDHSAATGTQTVTIPTTGTYTLTVATTNDSTDEADGSITATIDPGTGYTVSSSSDTATVNVSDDDDPPADDTTDTSDTATSGGAPAPTGPLTLTVADATATEGDSQGLRFVATLSRASDREIKLGYGAFDTTAKYNQDYTIPYRFYTINPGETQVEIIIPVVDDNVAESDETLAMYAYESTFTTILGFAYATGTIKDND